MTTAAPCGEAGGFAQPSIIESCGCATEHRIDAKISHILETNQQPTCQPPAAAQLPVMPWLGSPQVPKPLGLPQAQAVVLVPQQPVVVPVAFLASWQQS